MAVQKAMTGATRAMKTANQINSPERLQATMQEFEKQSMMMDMHEEYVKLKLATSGSSSSH